MDRIQKDNLEHEHDELSVARRLSSKPKHGMLGDFVLGSVDGTITTFAIVSGVAGAGLTPSIALILGLANVLADGFSMAVSGYLKARSDIQTLEQYRGIEEKHIELAPSGEREEIRQIFQAKGFSEDLLEEIVNTICADKELWTKTMLADEYGLHLYPHSPLRAGVVTFVSFVGVGCIPILPMFAGSTLSSREIFAISAVATALTFLVIGAIRGRVLRTSMLRTSVETLMIGGIAAALAFGAGAFLESIVGTS